MFNKIINAAINKYKVWKYPTKDIPIGFYCYTYDLSKPIVDGKIAIIPCPYWELRKDKPYQENGYCKLIGKGDWELKGTTHLWDQCKECGINEDYIEDKFLKDYKCCVCNKFNIKLWRQYNVFAESINLLCMKCACKDQDKIFPHDWQDSDQIGWLIPAVPTEDGSSYWGYTSVPQPGVDWWKNLEDY